MNHSFLIDYCIFLSYFIIYLFFLRAKCRLLGDIKCLITLNKKGFIIITIIYYCYYADLTASRISIIFNSSLISLNGIFSDDCIGPQGLLLYSSKQQKKRQLDNYRVISVISITGKVFERII